MRETLPVMPRSPLALLVAGLIAAATPASASATTLVLDDGTSRPRPYQGWIDRAQAPMPGGTVQLRLTRCPDAPAWAGGCADIDGDAIYLTQLARSPDRLLHEVGHFFDQKVLTPRFRARFMRLVGGRGAWDAPAQTDPPSEKFAEAYSVCARHRTLNAWYFGMYAYAPSPAVHAAVCSLIREADRAARRAAARRS